MNRAPRASARMTRGRASGEAKILRACVVQGGKVIEEQRLRKRGPLTIGTSPKNTFVIADPALPKSHELFAVHSGNYELVVTEGMRGKVSVDGSPTPVDFAELKSKGTMGKKGSYYHLPVNDSHRGKVIIGDVTIIFQFVVPPPAPAKPQLPAAARGTLMQQIDWPYAIALLVVFLIEAPFITYLNFAPIPEPMTLDTMDDRWANLIAPEYEPEEKKKPEPTKTKGEGPAEKKKAAKAKAADEPDDDPKKAAKKAARSKEIRKQLSGKGILAILGTTGDNAASGAVADVFGAGGLGGDLDGAFDGLSGVGIATGGERTTRGGGAGDAAEISGLKTSGGGNVKAGTKKERKVGSVKASAPEVDGSLDPSAIARVVRSRMRMVQDCYEKELKRDPSLSGKIEIEFTIGESGRIEEALVVHNGMGSKAVGSCIVGRLKRWRFPKPNGGSVTVTFPFIFTPSS